MSATTARSSSYRARIRPRSGGSRSGASRIDWEKAARVALVLVLVAILVSYVRPLSGLYENWQESRAAEARLSELQAESDRLKRRAEELKTPVAILREARAQGLVGEGEQPYVIKGLE